MPEPTQPTMPSEPVRAWLMEASEFIAKGGPCPSCRQPWVRFSDFEELLHSERCHYITLQDQLDEAVDAIFTAMEHEEARSHSAAQQ